MGFGTPGMMIVVYLECNWRAKIGSAQPLVPMDLNAVSAVILNYQGTN